MSIRFMDRLLVVGAGITGAVTSSILRKELPETCHLSVWDKSRGTGGRMNTSRSSSDPGCTVDLGAQYISAIPQDYVNHRKFYEDLQHEQILRPLECVIEGDRDRPPGTKHFASPDGISSVAKHFLKSSDADQKFDHLITTMNEQDGRWMVTTSGGVSEIFDAVILTMPVPQILALKGSISQTIDSQVAIKEKLTKVEYSSRFALGMFYEPGTKIDISWAAKYFKEDPVIVFVSVDHKKRGQEHTGRSPSLLVHTSVPFCLQHLEEDKDAVCQKYVLPRLQQLLPQLPKPAAVKCHKWRYSQVFKGYEESPGAVLLQKYPLLLCAGDGFTHSNFDGCVDSATTAANVVLQQIKLAQI